MTTITITDGISSSRAVYELRGDSLRMTASGGCRDALAASGCRLDESMGDDAIRESVWSAWAGDESGYDGDPHDNGLAVHVERSN